MYFIGVDGGGTKTQGLLCDASGQLLADHTVGPSNYQTAGLSCTQANLLNLLNRLISSSHICLSEVSMICFGLSGVDTPKDEVVLHDMLKQICPSTPYILVNDLAPLLRLGSKENRGVATIYGTGANVMGVDDTQQTYRLRALDYILGGIGGGFEIAQAALHFAFRADEHTCAPTRLLEEVPKRLGYETIDQLFHALYPSSTLPAKAYTVLPPLVFELASEGDAICIQLLKDFATTHAQLIEGILSQCYFDGAIPLVLGGSVFKGSAPFFLDIIKKALADKGFNITYTLPSHPPAYGSLLMALDQHMSLTSSHYINLGLPQ